MGRKILRKYSRILQQEVHTCGLYACLFVINYFGIKYVQEKTLRKKLDVDEPFFPILSRFGVQDEYLLGTTPMTMVRVLEEYGIRSELSQIRRKTSDRMQIALAVTMYYSHWIVYFRDSHTDEPMIYDPCGAIDYYKQYEDPFGNKPKGIRKINLFLPVSATNHLGKPEEPGNRYRNCVPAYREGGCPRRMTDRRRHSLKKVRTILGARTH